MRAPVEPQPDADAQAPVERAPLLSGCRVLEVGDHAAAFAGRVLQDLGCAVTRVEAPGGAPPEADLAVSWRTAGSGEGDSETVSATRLAWSLDKRSVPLDLESEDGQAGFARLLDEHDIVVVSGSPGWIEARGLTLDALRRGRPALVAVVITPFGFELPGREWAASDLTLQAAGGVLWMYGDEDRAPVRISEEMAWPHAGGTAAFAAATARFRARERGEGDGIDISIQEVLSATLMGATTWWQAERRILSRHSKAIYGRDIQMRQVWPCKDGYLCYRISFGLGSGKRNLNVTFWMEETGEAGDLIGVPWEYVSTLEMTQEQADGYQDVFGAFFLKRTRAELYAEALKRRAMLFPADDPIEMLDSDQLAARRFFVARTDASGRTCRVPGPFHVMQRSTPAGAGRPAPLAQPDASAGSTAARTARGRAGLLDGLVVCDFGWAVAGPILGRMLAHHGATVIKIESNTRLDSSRTNPPFLPRPHRDGSLVFADHNAGKLSCTLALKTDLGRELARRLIVASGVVRENFAPGVMAELGLDFDTMRELRPDLVMISASMQGQTGPNARHPGLGVTLQGITGLCTLTGWPDREPVGVGAYTDALTPWFAGAALAGALDHRARTGEGVYIDLSQLELSALSLAPALVHEQLTGIHHTRRGNASLVRSPEGVYPCMGEERWIAISVLDDAAWAALAAVIGHPAPGMRLDQRFAAAEAIDATITRWTSSRAASDVAAVLRSQKIAAHPVADSRDLLEDVQLADRGRWLTYDHPRIGGMLGDLPPWRLQDHPTTTRRSPAIGEHTDEVLRTVLGLTADEIADARAEGALE